jgi:nucleotide-binding universal stress UspA family protein
MFHNILVAYDGSSDSRLALAQAIDLAQSERARLTVMTGVVTPPPAVYYGYGGDATVQLVREAQTQAAALLREAKDRIPLDLPVTTIQTSDPIRSAIVKQVKRGNHDLVVIGSRGRRGLRALLFGSVSRFVLDRSEVPVLVVHADKHAQVPVTSFDPAPAEGRLAGQTLRLA